MGVGSAWGLAEASELESLIHRCQRLWETPEGGQVWVSPFQEAGEGLGCPEAEASRAGD